MYDDDSPIGFILGIIFFAVLLGGTVTIVKNIEDEKNATSTDAVVHEKPIIVNCYTAYNSCKSACDSNSYYPEDCYKWCDSDKKYCEEKENQEF